MLLAVALSEAPDKSEDLVLVVDVGTNAEILLGNQGKAFLPAPPPPARRFEGAQISSAANAPPPAPSNALRSTRRPRNRASG